MIYVRRDIMSSEKNEIKAIKGIVLDEIFLSKSQYSNQALGIIAAACSKKIPVIIRCVSKENASQMLNWLIEKKVQCVDIEGKPKNLSDNIAVNTKTQNTKM